MLRPALLACVVACAQPQRPVPPATPAPAPATATPRVRGLPGNPAWIGVFFAAGSTKVEQVLAGGPAQAAGVLAGDVVVAVDRAPVKLPSDVTAAVRMHAAGERVAIELVRDGKTRELSIVVEERPDTRTLIDRALLGHYAPDFAAEPISGGTTKLADLAGSVVLIDFWATWCGPCHAAMPSLVQWHQKYGGRGLRIVGVSNESREDIERFLRDQPLPYAIGHDDDDKMWRAYLVQGVPTTVLVDRKGIIRYVELGLGDHAKTEAMIERLLAP